MTKPLPNSAVPKTPINRLVYMWNAMLAFPSNFTSLMRNGYALIFGTIIASGLGMLFWAIAARLLSPEDVGIGAALIAMLSTLSHAAQLNLRNLLYRFVPGAGRHAVTILRVSFLVAAVTATILGFGLTKFSVHIAPDLAFVSTSVVFQVAFIIALLVWTLYSLQEAALTSLRLSGFVPIQTMAYSILKIILLLCMLTFAPSGTSILASWVVPAVLVGLGMNLIVRKRLAELEETTQTASALPTRMQIAGYFGWDYVGSLATSVTLGAVPLLIVAVSGPAELAAYYMAWSITYLLYLVGRHLGAAMLAEVATKPTARLALYAQALVFTLVPATFGALIIVLFAPQIMWIFGADYVASGTQSLRILAMASIPGSAIAVYLAVCRAEDWLYAIAAIQITVLAFVLGLGYVLTNSFGVVGMATSWLTTQLFLSLVIAIVLTKKYGISGVFSFVLDMINACFGPLQDIAKLVPGKTSENSIKMSAPIKLGGHTWQIEKVLGSLSDAQTIFLSAQNPSQEIKAVLKSAQSHLGKQALRTEHDKMANFCKGKTQHPLVCAAMPHILAFEIDDDEIRLLTAKLPGVDGRQVITGNQERALALKLAANYINQLCISTKTPVKPDPAWLDRWIDAPIDRIQQAATHGFFAQGFSNALQDLGEDLRAHWKTSPAKLAFHHGDFCPDNILYERDVDGKPTTVAGLVDWGRAQKDGPVGLDACNLAIAMRMQESGHQLGQIVLDLIRAPQWRNDELQYLNQAESDNGWTSDAHATRAMVTLAWLQHIDANLEKSNRYAPNSYWWLANVSQVVLGYLRFIKAEHNMRKHKRDQ